MNLNLTLTLTCVFFIACDFNPQMFGCSALVSQNQWIQENVRISKVGRSQQLAVHVHRFVTLNARSCADK